MSIFLKSKFSGRREVSNDKSEKVKLEHFPKIYQKSTHSRVSCGQSFDLTHRTQTGGRLRSGCIRARLGETYNALVVASHVYSFRNPGFSSKNADCFSVVQKTSSFSVAIHYFPKILQSLQLNTPILIYRRIFSSASQPVSPLNAERSTVSARKSASDL